MAPRRQMQGQPVGDHGVNGVFLRAARYVLERGQVVANNVVFVDDVVGSKFWQSTNGGVVVFVQIVGIVAVLVVHHLVDRAGSGAMRMGQVAYLRIVVLAQVRARPELAVGPVDQRRGLIISTGHHRLTKSRLDHFALFRVTGITQSDGTFRAFNEQDAHTNLQRSRGSRRRGRRRYYEEHPQDQPQHDREGTTREEENKMRCGA